VSEVQFIFMLCSVVLPKGKKTKPNPKQPKAETSERASPNNTQNKQKLSRNGEFVGGCMDRGDFISRVLQP